jgi:ribosomal protein L11 methylase PrmA
MLNLLVSLALMAFCLLILYYLAQGALYVPTHKITVGQMMDLVHPKPGLKIADLGSGDGRIVIAAALAGAEAVGFEINPLLVWYSRFKAKKAGLDPKALIQTANFWKQDLGSFDVIFVFGISHIMKKLSKKFDNELRPDSIVVSNAFELPGFEQIRKTGSLFVYKAKESGVSSQVVRD